MVAELTSYFSCDTGGGVFNGNYKRVKPKGVYSVYPMMWTCPGCTEQEKIKQFGREKL